MGMFPMHFEAIFWIVFALTLALIVFWWIVAIVRITKGRRVLQGEITSENQSMVKEREIIREIVKIRCPYCGHVYEEKLDRCSHCGGKKP